jgi:putative two-component system response regulator
LEVESLYLENNFDIILLDIQMPNMDGFQVMDKLNELEMESYIPILVLTALTDRDTRLRALKCGARDFITKPIDRLETLHRIRNILEVRILHNKLTGQKKILEEKVKERTQDLEQSRVEIIHRLGRAAEYRDNETGLHIIRMSKFSQMLALEMGLPENESEMLLQASPMHDVGKIGISDNILLKPGKLTKEEFETMKTHTSIGADILANSDSEVLEMAQKIAITHHEKWNGKGYPNGLKGAEIPLIGRIVAICDVFDALTSERPYKHAWPVQEAIDEIVSQKGEHFDPEVVEYFLKVLPAVIKVKDEYAEPSIESN